MKISINNFKSIGALANYELRPLTILSGTNSSGKSSFIQLLLLLKQTLAIDSSYYPLILNGEFLKFYNYVDILNGKKKENKLKIHLVFNKSELYKYIHFHEISVYEAFNDYDLHIHFELDCYANQIVVDYFEVKFIISDGDSKESFIQFWNSSELIDIKTNVAVFNDELYSEQGNYKVKRINFSAFIPIDFEIEYEGEIETRKGEKDIVKNNIKGLVKLEGIKTIIKDFVSNLNYIGPLRLEPKDEYKIFGTEVSVGADGGFAAEVLFELSEKQISHFVIDEHKDEVTFIKKTESFIHAVKYWLCERFKMCSSIYAKKEADSYVIYVKSWSGIESTIKHVGFGISQILPIIVEGLRLKEGETLVLEQPEIHLHPKVQSNLADFLIAMVKSGKKVVLETHSDHLITRFRRRIAEDITGSFRNEILLTFVEVGGSDVLFRNIDIDDLGNLDYFPTDFIENPEIELKAILKAQMKKRLSKKEQ